MDVSLTKYLFKVKVNANSDIALDTYNFYTGLV